MRTYRARSIQRIPRQQYWLVRELLGEDIRIYPMTGTKAHLENELKQPNTRLFDPSKDDRGVAVKITLTYGVRDDVWHPQTEGQYFITFKENCPKEQKIQLHFGDVSSPQSTKAAVHRILLDILQKFPHLQPYLRCVKRPCVFCKDHPDAPGGSMVEVDIATLPPACDNSQVAKFYM